jgi:hypothetical protein
MFPKNQLNWTHNMDDIAEIKAFNSGIDAAIEVVSGELWNDCRCPMCERMREIIFDLKQLKK